MDPKFDAIVEEIVEQDSRYELDAYSFVMEALSFTQKKLKRRRHIKGCELLDGIKELMMRKFGPMSMMVLEHWGVKDTEDFGNIVFNLVENCVLSKTGDDDIESFREGYDFEEVFCRGYRKRLDKKISRMRTM